MSEYKYLTLLFAVVMLTSCWSDQAPMPVGTDTYYDGNVVRGSKFGLTVGSKANSLKERVNGVSFLDYVACNSELRHLAGCSSNQRFLMFDIEQESRKGELYARVQNGVVQQIIWRTSLGRIES